MTWIISKIVGSPYFLIALLIAAFVAGGSAVGYVQGVRIDALKVKLSTLQEKHDAFVSATKAEGESAAEREKLKTEGYEYTLKKVKADYESQIPAIRANAVANYLSAHGLPESGANTCSGQVLGNGTGIRLDDGAVKKFVPDEAFIADAAEDAAKVGAFQAYCTMNKCPVKD